MDAAPSRYTRYTTEDQQRALIILQENDGSYAATERATGIPATTIRSWVDGRVQSVPVNLAQEEKLKRAEQWDKLQDAGISRALEKVGDASAKDAALVAAIAADKAAMLRGEGTGSGTQVTVNVAPISISLTPADIEAARALLAGVRPLPPAQVAQALPPASGPENSATS